MSTLEKTISLLENMPDNKIETVYSFVRFINSETYENMPGSAFTKKKDVRAVLGVAHEYANPALIEQEDGAFERAMVKKYASDRY